MNGNSDLDKGEDGIMDNVYVQIGLVTKTPYIQQQLTAQNMNLLY